MCAKMKPRTIAWGFEKVEEVHGPQTTDHG